MQHLKHKFSVIYELIVQNAPKLTKQSKEERDSQIKAYFERIQNNGEDGVIAVPFYSPISDKIVYLPYNLTLSLTGSNGMAAGNTASEGIFQALCEIVERYSASQVYYKQLTPPTIPAAFIESFPDEQLIIKDIENQGYIVEVKDFSAGLNLPAVGVIVYDKNKTSYKLNVGAETSFKNALSRALTEIHQGLNNKKEFDNRLLAIPVKEHEYFCEDTKCYQALRSVQIRKFIIDGSGVLPKSLFNNESSYPFVEDIFCSSETYNAEINCLIKLFSDLGHDVFIRDVSFLGFPSYYVFIPNISIFGRKTYEDASNTMTLLDTVGQDTIEDLFFPTSKFINDKAVIRKLVDAIAPNREEAFTEVKMQEVLKLKFDSNFYWSNIPVSFFLTLFCYVLGEYANSKKYLKMFIEESGNSNDEYYIQILTYLSYLENGEKEKAITHISPDIIQEFSSTENLFSDIKLPNCPNCNDCLLKNSCQTRPSFNIALRISDKMNKQINQLDLRDLFIAK